MSKSVAIWAIMLACVGCGDDDARDAPDGEDDGPLYAVSSNSFSADLSEENTLLWLVDDLRAGTLDPRDAIELPGGGTLWGEPKSGLLYVVSGEDVTLTKYTVEKGTLKRLGRLGLGSNGVSSLIGEQLVFASSDRGYLFDLQSGQALKLDLDAMEITGTIDLSDALVDQTNLLAGPGFRPHGDRLVTAVYGTSAEYDRVAQESRLLFFDPSSESIETKPAPGGLAYSVAGAAGELFFASDPFVASVYLLDEDDGPRPSLARLGADEDTLDAPLDLNALTGGPTGGLVAGPDGSAYLRVLDPEYTPDADAAYLDVYSAPAWQTWQLDLADPGSASRVDGPPTTGNIKVFEVDGATYQNEATEDFSSTRLTRTSDDEPATTALEMPGVTWGVVRLR